MENDESEFGDLLDDLLANADEPEEETPNINKKLTELDFNFIDSVTTLDKETTSPKTDKSTEIHEGNTDSSDDEDKRCFEDKRYSESGRELKAILNRNTQERHDRSPIVATKKKQSFDFNQGKRLGNTTDSLKPIAPKDVYSDPIFGLRIVKPLVSSAELKERMTGRIPVTVSKVKNHLATQDLHNDWVIAGVLISKSPARTSQKGSQYCIWKISDLSDDMKSVSLFLFSGAFKSFWKTTTGTVIGVLNPSTLDNRDNNDQAALSVDNAQRIMILGNSKDMGVCRSKKKNGEPCSSIVNTSRCEYCIYHVKQEYSKCSRRAELQSSSVGRGLTSMDALRNKVLGKGETIYGGQSYAAIPAKKNYKQMERDRNRLSLLTSSRKPENVTKIQNDSEMKRKASLVELTSNQVKKDMERLSKLRASSDLLASKAAAVSEPVTGIRPSTTSPVAAKQHSLSKLSNSSNIPKLGAGLSGSMIDLSEPVSQKRINSAKVNALKWIQQNGAIKRTSPNKVRLSKEEKLEKGNKRQREDDKDSEETNTKKKALADKFKKMIEATSNHVDLIEKSDEQEKEKYFNKLEMKEKMEEKMMTTFKVDCKAVRCIVCKYTAFSASDFCKEQRHPLRVTDGVKRFFKCSDCGNRTVSLDRIPSYTCKNCSSSNWVRAAMMDEKRTNIPGQSLSIRGGEEKFLGSTIKEASLNLLVPEAD